MAALLSFWVLFFFFLGSCHWTALIILRCSFCKEPMVHAKEDWALWALSQDLFSAPNLHWAPKDQALCSHARWWATAQRRPAQPHTYHPHFLLDISLQPDHDLLDGNFHIYLLSTTSMTRPVICLKLWVFNKNYLEKEMHVETLKGTVTMLFVLSPKERKKKTWLFFFFLILEERWRKDSHLAKF